MIFNGFLCLNADSVIDAKNLTTGSIDAGGWPNFFHLGWYLYLSLYGEYAFELNGQYYIISFVPLSDQ